MLLGEPSRTQFDLNFSLAGFAIRISPWFWLVALLLTSGGGRPSGMQMLVGVLVVLVSILVHELGHAIAMRRYGESARIVLYQFGGLAIPEDQGFGFVSRRTRNPIEQVIISAAGPMAGLSLAIVVALFVYVAGGSIVIDTSEAMPMFFANVTGTAFDNPALALTLNLLLFVNIWWTVLNLMPIYPLDGGQIARELFLLKDPWHGLKNASWLSLIVAGALALWGFANQRFFMGIMFASLAYSSYQVIEQLQGRGGPGGRRPW